MQSQSSSPVMRSPSLGAEAVCSPDVAQLIKQLYQCVYGSSSPSATEPTSTPAVCTLPHCTASDLAEWNLKQTEWTEEKQALEQTCDKLKQQVQSLEQQVQSFQQELRHTMKSLLHAQKKVAELEEFKKEQHVLFAQQLAKPTFELKEKTTELEQWKQTCDTQKQQITRLENEVSKTQSRHLTPTYIGRDAELQIREFLDCYLSPLTTTSTTSTTTTARTSRPTANVIEILDEEGEDHENKSVGVMCDTSRQLHQGDLQWSWEGVRCMLDSKNVRARPDRLTTYLKQSEIDKFLRDVDENQWDCAFLFCTVDIRGAAVETLQRNHTLVTFVAHGNRTQLLRSIVQSMCMKKAQQLAIGLLPSSSATKKEESNDEQDEQDDCVWRLPLIQQTHLSQVFDASFRMSSCTLGLMTNVLKLVDDWKKQYVGVYLETKTDVIDRYSISDKPFTSWVQVYHKQLETNLKPKWRFVSNTSSKQAKKSPKKRARNGS